MTFRNAIAVFLLAGCAQLPAFAAPSRDDLIVPDLIGKTRDEANLLVRAAGFTNAVESSRPVECEGAAKVEGRINCQQPHAGKLVKKYEVIQVNVYKKTRIAGAIVRDELAALIGLTPDEARAKLDDYGHDGEVTVEPGKRFYEGCGEKRVCGFNVPESGMGVHDPITLYVNPGLKFSAPPPQ